MESVRSRWKVVVAVILAVICVIGGCSGVAYLWHENWETMGDFSALWNTTDGIQHHISEFHQWPRDWESLRPSVRAVDGSAEISYLRERIEVNFEVDRTTSSLNDAWYVRVKSGRLPNEQATANQQLRKHFPTLIDRRGE